MVEGEIARGGMGGEDLRRSVARNGRLPVDRAIAIAGRLGAALDFAHGRGIVHRDVKPGEPTPTLWSLDRVPLSEEV